MTNRELWGILVLTHLGCPSSALSALSTPRRAPPAPVSSVPSPTTTGAGGSSSGRPRCSTPSTPNRERSHLRWKSWHAKQSLAWYTVECIQCIQWLCGPKSGFKGLFSKLKVINIQHWPCCQSSMISAVLKTTVNSELRNLTSESSRQLGTWEKNKLQLEKYFLNGHPTWNCKSGTRASF